jgi:hypothetical protein
MKKTIFLSWSGPTSKHVATALSDWLRNVFVQGIDIWMSPERIGLGYQWPFEVAQSLAQCSFGIICLTPDNRSAPWILFEAGALSKTFPSARVIPYLFRLKTTDVEFPLALFQSVEATNPGTWDLVKSINETLDEAIDTSRLRLQFDKWWAELAEAMDKIPATTAPEVASLRSDRALSIK